MAEEKTGGECGMVRKGGYQPLEKGYKPTQGELDSKNPPQGGSGVPTLMPTTETPKKPSESDATSSQ